MKQGVIVILSGLTIIGLVVAAASIYDAQAIQKYQPLIAAAVAATFALGAAVIAWRNVQLQIGNQRSLEDDRRARSGLAARVSLPLALSAISGYAKDCAMSLTSLRKRPEQDGLITVSIAKIPKLPNFDQSIIPTLTKCIEFAEPNPRDALADLIATMQVQRSQLEDATSRWKRGTGEAKIVVHELEGYILDSAEVYARATELFDYARREDDEVQAGVTFADIVNAFLIAEIREEDFPKVFEFRPTDLW